VGAIVLGFAYCGHEQDPQGVVRCACRLRDGGELNCGDATVSFMRIAVRMVA
jgi:hypothetical protein